jgi:hypothetical protein
MKGAADAAAAAVAAAFAAATPAEDPQKEEEQANVQGPPAEPQSQGPPAEPQSQGTPAEPQSQPQSQPQVEEREASEGQAQEVAAPNPPPEQSSTSEPFKLDDAERQRAGRSEPSDPSEPAGPSESAEPAGDVGGPADTAKARGFKSQRDIDRDAKRDRLNAIKSQRGERERAAAAREAAQGVGGSTGDGRSSAGERPAREKREDSFAKEANTRSSFVHSTREGPGRMTSREQREARGTGRSLSPDERRRVSVDDQRKQDRRKAKAKRLQQMQSEQDEKPCVQQ